MNKKYLYSAAWFLNHGSGHLGAAGVFGLGILLVCLAAYVSFVQPAMQHPDVLQIVSPVKKPIDQKTQSEGVLAQLQRQLSSFYEFFPERIHMAEQVENLFATAKKYKLNLENGTYELIPGKDKQLTRCEVQLPIHGSYVQTRRFLAEIMQEMPNVALTTFEIHREKIGTSAIDAQVKLTMFYQAG